MFDYVELLNNIDTDLRQGHESMFVPKNSV